MTNPDFSATIGARVLPTAQVEWMSNTEGIVMNQTQILQDFNALPAEAQDLVSSLVAFLGREQQRSKSSRRKNAIHLTDEKFIGLWKDRDDMQDSSAYIRTLRKNEWS